jgi:hypothetical protein
MQRTVSIAAAALLVSVAFVGCTDSNKDQAGASGLLSVELRASHSGVAAEEVRAGYGFTVNELGVYRVGPGPAGETIEGDVTPAELGKLMAAVNGSESAASSAEEALGPAEVVGEEVVTIHRGNLTQSKISASSTGFDPGAVGRTQAESLHKAIRDLAVHYYPDRFPGECAVATANLMKLYPQAKACQQDADCGYVHWDFTLADGEQYISTDICKWSRPLVAANLKSVEAAYADLVAAFNTAETACAQRSDCTRAHLLTSAAAVCDAGVCKANPALSY